MSGSVRTEPCACGGAISVVLPATGQAIGEAVLAHQRGPRHEEWGRLGGPAYDPELQGRQPVAVLGPAPCGACRAQLWWTGYAWIEGRGQRHFCPRAVA